MKPFGPVHEYVAPATVLAVRVNVCPAQSGELFDTTGAGEVGLTVILTTASVSPARLHASPFMILLNLMIPVVVRFEGV